MRGQALGRLLFRWRSLTPLPVIAGVIGLLVIDAGAPGGLSTRAWLGLVGVGLALLGQALRAWVLGQVPEGTSGQGSGLEASTLNTCGPYAHVRNPLYVGNLLIVLGLMWIAWNGWALLLALAFFFGQYHFIILAEEAFLREKFGARFDRYCDEVPRWLPRLRPANRDRLSARYDWRRALKKEHNPFAAWASGALALFALELGARDLGALARHWPWFALAEGVVCLLFALVKGWKRRWWGALKAPTA